MTATITPLEALRRLIAEVKQLDAVEVGARWNQLQGELGVAEGVVRDYVQQPTAYIRPAGLDNLKAGRTAVVYPCYTDSERSLCLYAAPVAAKLSEAPQKPVVRLMHVDEVGGSKTQPPVFDIIVLDRARCKDGLELFAAPTAAVSAASSGEVERDAARWRYSMDFQRNTDQTHPQEMTAMWRKVMDDGRTHPTVEEYEAATDAAMAAQEKK